MMDVKELSITPKALTMNLTMINRNVTMIIVVIIDPTRERFEMRKIVTFLWFNNQAKEAVDFYVSLFEDAKIINTTYLTESVAKAAGKKPGDISAIDFELNGQNFTALNGGPLYTFSEAISIAVYCNTQEEIDKLWDALTEGGEVLSCGWLKDKYGLTWQIVPECLDIMMRDPDPVKAERVSAAMLRMEGKLMIRELEKAYRGE
jgi:predicted 3-demethylubiquinone-9 3-methyltransferase (glyoxalase superfamily)